MSYAQSKRYSAFAYCHHTIRAKYLLQYSYYFDLGSTKVVNLVKFYTFGVNKYSFVMVGVFAILLMLWFVIAVTWLFFKYFGEYILYILFFPFAPFIASYKIRKDKPVIATLIAVLWGIFYAILVLILLL